MRENISKELLELIVLYIDSVEQLEIFLLLYTNPEQEWTLTELDARIRSTTASIQARLIKLIQLGFVSKSSEEQVRFRYLPVSEEMNKIGGELALLYQTRRVEVIELIYTKPMKEIISFSSAFLIKGRQKKDG